MTAQASRQVGTDQPAVHGDALRAIGIWLMLVALLVFVMIVLGGITRLTGSGLSMVEWRPVTGWLPPLSIEVWQREFDAYRAYPEYRLINRGMSLSEFKQIYWFEYAHRLLGRIIGLAFAIPFLVFLLRRRVPRPMVLRLAGLFLLGGLQGALGWFMVQSGLVDRPDVSHYRLAMHLGLAFVIFGALFWAGLSCLRGIMPGRSSAGWRASSEPPPYRSGVGQIHLARTLLALLLLQFLAGALVAGLNAGMTYNTWPLMDGRLVPSGLWALAPWWLNPFENITLVQFQHRLLGYLILLLAIWLWFRARRTAAARTADLVLLAVFLQVVIGIATLLLVVPIGLAAAHQGAAAILLAIVLAHLHGLIHGPATTGPVSAGARVVQPLRR